MHQGKGCQFEESPRKKANIFSIVTFYYSLATIKKGRTKELQEDDIHKILPSFSSQSLGDKLESHWHKSKKQKKGSLLNSLKASFGGIYLFYTVIHLVFGTTAVLLQPTLFSKFVSYFQPGQHSISKKDCFIYALGMLGFNLLNVLYTANLQLLVGEYTLKIKAAICSLVYRKALRINYGTFTDITIGKIVTLVTKDVSIITSALPLIKDMMISMIQLAVVTVILYLKVGISALPAMAVLILIIPIQLFIGRKVSVARMKSFENTDRRFLLIQETLSSIKTIKMYTWEKYFANLITKARRMETKSISLVYFLKLLILSLGTSTINLAFYVLIISYIVTGNQIEAETVYYLQQCLQFLQSGISRSIPFGILQTSDAVAALTRIQVYLDAEEMHKSEATTQSFKTPEIFLSRISVSIKGTQVLKSVSLHIEKGLLLLTGSTGSGKSVLLSTILGEYPICNGEISVKGTISYAGEVPWVFPSTIRQNILFGEEYDKRRYQEVLNVCALTQDINRFEKLDQTIVGDKGLNLSKGQQARISLARAIYKDSDIYLLDDCLASLDNSVSNHIFNQCIKGFLKNKICIFVSNNIDNIASMPTGRVIFIENGNTLDLDQQSASLDKRITYYIDENIGYNDKYASKHSNLDVLDEESEVDQHINETTNLLMTSNEYEMNRNLYEEKSKEGQVSWNVYIKYFKYFGGLCSTLIFFSVLLIAQLVISSSDKLISQWVNLETRITNLTHYNQTDNAAYGSAMEKRNHLLIIYTVVIVSSFFLATLRDYVSLNNSIAAARRLHKAMVMGIINACMYFFDNHYIGNVINRLSKDFQMIDEALPFFVLEICRLLFAAVGITVLIASVNWQFLIPSAFLFIKLYLVRRMCIPASRSLRRLEASTRSPVVGYLNSTLEGLLTIRALKKENLLLIEFNRHLDVSTSAAHMSQTTGAFFGLILDIFGVFFIMSVALKFLFWDTGTLAGDVGLAISQAMMLSMILQHVVRSMTELERSMTSVERVIEYTDVELEEKSGEVCHDWPKSGRIAYSNVSLTYRSNENTVLRNINLIIGDKSKIAVVGRTGAGKSSIISALYRLYDFQGDIYVDGENIKSLNLDFLRSNIGIIPQDPLLFSGSIRVNLDPFNKLKDEEIWSALSKVNLAQVVPSLEDPISSTTATYSSGQKQLLCLARALLGSQKIIVLDEPTANIDPETDILVQKVIREHFKECTVITIAHRLSSILDSDKILVLDEGRVMEYESPENLLANKKSLFYKMTKNEHL